MKRRRATAHSFEVVTLSPEFCRLNLLIRLGLGDIPQNKITRKMVRKAAWKKGVGSRRDAGAEIMRPLVIDLYCGLGGWTRGFLAEGYEAVGFDLERHHYGAKYYPAQLALQDVRSCDGSQFLNATCIVGSSPCQEFSYRAMPWKRAKALPPPELGMELFNAQFRLQREASEAAGHHIPMVVENVCGAQKWVGRAAWHYGSYYLWGDVPALMPTTKQ